MLVYMHNKKHQKIVESIFISNHNPIKHKAGFFFFRFVSLFGQLGAEKLQNPLLFICILISTHTLNWTEMERKRLTLEKARYGMFIMHRYEVNNININIDRLMWYGFFF